MHFFNVGVAELVYASVSEADEFFSCEFESHHLHQKDCIKTAKKVVLIWSFFLYLCLFSPIFYILFAYSLIGQKIGQKLVKTQKCWSKCWSKNWSFLLLKN